MMTTFKDPALYKPPAVVRKFMTTKLLLLTTSLIFVFGIVFGQRNDYKYTYEFIIENSIKENRQIIDSLYKEQNSELEFLILDIQNEILPGLIVKISTNKRQFEKNVNEKGVFNLILLENEIGNLEITYIGHQSLNLPIEYKENKQIKAKIYLAPLKELPTIYVIHSKKKLKKKEIQHIKRQLKLSKDLNTIQNDNYYITQQL